MTGRDTVEKEQTCFDMATCSSTVNKQLPAVRDTILNRTTWGAQWSTVYVYCMRVVMGSCHLSSYAAGATWTISNHKKICCRFKRSYVCYFSKPVHTRKRTSTPPPKTRTGKHAIIFQQAMRCWYGTLCLPIGFCHTLKVNTILPPPFEWVVQTNHVLARKAPKHFPSAPGATFK